MGSSPGVMGSIRLAIFFASLGISFGLLASSSFVLHSEQRPGGSLKECAQYLGTCTVVTDPGNGMQLLYAGLATLVVSAAFWLLVIRTQVPGRP